MFRSLWYLINDDEFLPYDDRLILTYVDYHGRSLSDVGCSLVMIHCWYIKGSCERSYSSWWWCDDYGVFTYDMMWMILCYCLEIWHMLSWFMEGYDKALSTKETEQVDIDEIKRMSWYLYATYFVTGWWYLHWHGHIQVAGLDVVDRCLWSRSYMVYDSCWWLSWSSLDIWSLL